MHRWVARLLALAAVTVMGACGGDDAESSAAGCEPVGDGGGTKVEVVLDEWKVAPAAVSAPAGKVTFDVKNQGAEAHELVVVKAASAAELKIVDGKVDEEALPAGAFVGEVEAFPAGQSCPGTFDLSPGTYVLFCNIVEEHDGKPESHVEEGMLTTFTVR